MKEKNNEVYEKNENNKENKISQSDTNLINLKAFKDDLDQNNNNRKSVVSLNESKSEIKKESESSSNLNNLSLLFRSYIHKTKNISIIKDNNQKKRRSILPISFLNKRSSIKEKNEYIDENENILNLYNIIRDRIEDAKSEVLQYLEASINKLKIKYNNYMNSLNE